MHGMAALEKGRSRAGWGSGLCQWLLGLSYSCLPGHEPGQLLGQERPQHPYNLLEGELWPRLLNPAS